MPKPKPKHGQPSTYTEAMADEICAWIEQGKTLREFCRLEGKPAWRTVYDWQKADEDFAARFARARDIGHDVIAEEALAIIDEQAEFATGENGGSHRDSAHVKWLQNRAEMRLKLLAKWNPKKYGDRVQHDHKLDGDITIRFSNGKVQS